MKLLIVSLLLLLGLTASLLWVMHRGPQWESPISEQPAMPVQEAINPPEPWQPRSIQTDLPASSKGEKIRYGYDLITETYKYLGPELEDANSIYAGNNKKQLYV